MVWLIFLGILVLLVFVPLGVSALYDSSGASIRIIAGPLRVKVFPFKRKAEKGKPPKEKKEVRAKKASSPSTEHKGGKIKDFMPLVQIVFDLVRDFGRKLRVDRLEANIILAGDDPSDLAINYGRVWAALGNMWPRLEELFVIKKRNVQVQCDFVGSDTLITARLDLTITLGRIFSLGACYGIRSIKELLKIKNKSKGGARI